MHDRNGTNDLSNGAVRYGAYDADGNLLRYEWIRPEDDPLEAGTPLSKDTFLSDEAETLIWLIDVPEDATVSDALKHIVGSHDVGDTLTTVRTLSAPWHECDGSTFSRTQYPALYAALGSATLPTISYSDDTTTYIKMADE